MAKDQVHDEHKRTVKRPVRAAPEKTHDSGSDAQPPINTLQQQVGNRAVQRLIAQRSGGTDGPFEVDKDTAGKIQAARGGGQPLEGGVQEQMSASLDQDFSGVRVHNSAQDDALNHELGAKAFTTGQDIFFRDGAYDPHSSGGQALLAHELTHVVQQGGSAPTSGPMVVNAPGDAYEQQAESTAAAVSGPSPTAGSAVQRQELEKNDESMVQKAPADEKKDLAMVQKAAADEKKDEAMVQKSPADEKKDQAMVQKAPADEKKDEAVLQKAPAGEKKDEAMVQKAAAEDDKKKENLAK